MQSYLVNRILLRETMIAAKLKGKERLDRHFGVSKKPSAYDSLEISTKESNKPD